MIDSQMKELRTELSETETSRINEELADDKSLKNGGVRKRRGKRALFRRVARRCAQGAAAFFFGVLFFYVCCPYPTDAPRTSNGWLPLSVDGESGRVSLQNPSGEPVLERGATRWLVDASSEPAATLGEFRVVESRSTQEQENASSTGGAETAEVVETTLEPVAPLALEQLDALTLTFGEITVCESDPDAPPSHCARRLTEKTSTFGRASTALACDPLVGAVAASGSRRDWNDRIATVVVAAAILALSTLFARAFCGWICPMGAAVDFVDFLLKPIRVAVHKLLKINNLNQKLKTSRALRSTDFRFFLAAALIGATFAGVAVVGWFAPIPTLTRNADFGFAPFQTAAFRGWGQVPAATWGARISLVVFATFFGLGVFGKRAFCRWICPSGAIFSLFGRLKIFGYSIDSARCVDCRRCAAVCSFDAISPFETETGESGKAGVRVGATCVSCGECAAVCPRNAIVFRSVFKNLAPNATAEEARASSRRSSRRRALGFGIGVGVSTTLGALFGRSTTSAANSDSASSFVRPPGALDERMFLQRCVRCGECFRACPNDALQPIDLDGGLARLWTPRLNANWSGCEPSCNNCGRVCPTGAIRPLEIAEKRRFVVGTAVVDKDACLPFADVEDCRLCFDECERAGYDAIEFVAVGTELDENGRPVEGVGFLAPVVSSERCVGCGLCQARCFAINVRVQDKLTRSAIRVFPRR